MSETTSAKTKKAAKAAVLTRAKKLIDKTVAAVAAMRAALGSIMADPNKALDMNTYLDACSAIYTLDNLTAYIVLKACLGEHLKNLSKAIMELGIGGVELLNVYHREWKKYSASAEVIGQLFQAIDHHLREPTRFDVYKIHDFNPVQWRAFFFEPTRFDVYKIHDLSLVQWRAFFFEPCKKELVFQLIRQINNDREGNEVDTEMIREIITSLTILDPEKYTENWQEKKRMTKVVYVTEFEEPFLKATRVYYQEKANGSSGNTPGSMVKYLHDVHKWLEMEVDLADRYLDQRTLPILMQTCQQVLVDAHATALHKAFQNLGSDMDRVRCFIYELLGKIMYQTTVAAQKAASSKPKVAQKANADSTGDSSQDTDSEDVKGEQPKAQSNAVKSETNNIHAVKPKPRETKLPVGNARKSINVGDDGSQKRSAWYKKPGIAGISAALGPTKSAVKLHTGDHRTVGNLECPIRLKL